MRLKPFIGLIFFTLTPLLFAQTPEGDQKVSELPAYQKAFYNLPEKTRNAFVKHQNEAGRLFSAEPHKRIFESLEALKLAEKEFADSPELWNLRGSCYVELRSFDKALECFNKAAKIAGENYSILFNIGEVYFVTQKWQQAHDAFDSLLKKLPEERVDLNRITEFKLMLCKIKLDRMQEARILAEKYDYLDDSPYYYFSMAALAYQKQENAEAEQWIARAGRIFRNPAILAPWHDTLVEFGYIKSFYGEGE